MLHSNNGGWTPVMRTINSSKPTRHAVGFRVIREDGSNRVVWLDQIEGESVSVRDKIKSATPKLARERLKRLEKLARDQQPRVVWCDSKNSYQLWVKIDGRTRRVGLSEKDHDLALQKVPRKMIEMGWSADVEARATFGDAIDAYLAARRDRPGATQRASICANLLFFFTHEKPVSSFTRRDQTDWQSFREGIAAGTLNAETQVLNAALNQAVREGLAASRGEKWEKLAEPEADRLVISKSDWAGIVDVAANMLRGSVRTGRLSNLELYLYLVRYTGGRRSFYADLKWDRIDLERKVINFAVVGEIYTTKKRPFVPISDELLPILKRAKAEARSKSVLSRTNFDTMFRSLRAAMARSNNDRMRELAPVIHSHAFRRSFITWCVAEGFSPWVIGKITGNSSRIIEKTYAVYHPDHALGLVNKV